ncbi:MAG: stalk domain-containing protein [Desulfotomaculaceae bacterium]|nr:stalk domain-containing protein [Desulfotomaculaceae bacterium]
MLGMLLLFQQSALADCRLVINKSTNQLAFYENGYLVDVFPVATGRLPQFTPEGDWQVVVKLLYPSWRHPDGGPTIPGGIPENPLGPRWLGLNALGTGGSSYGVHGTNNPYSIGTHASSGCIRMYNEDILWLYDRVPVGAQVAIISSSEDLNSWKIFSTVQVNGNEPDFAPHLGAIQDGSKTWLPVRPAAEALGYHLFWDEASNTLRLANIDREVTLALGSQQVSVNNSVYATEDAPFLLEDMTFVPDYFFERFLEAELSQDTGNSVLSLQSPADPWGGRLFRYQMTIQVDGKPINLPESQPTLSDGENLLVPIRPVCTAAGGIANWNGSARTVDIMLRDKRVQIPENGSPALVNGSIAHEPSGIQIVRGTSYVSLRFLAELFGFITEVNENTSVINISTITAPTSIRGPTGSRLSSGVA